MNRAPAFQFYAADWFDFKVQRMSYAAQGVYIKLLAFMWKDSKDQSSITDNDNDIARVLGTSAEQWLEWRAEIQRKDDPIFEQKNGKLISIRLKKEAEKQLSYRQLQKDKALSRQARHRLATSSDEARNEPEGSLQSSSSVFSLQSSSSVLISKDTSSSAAAPSGEGASSQPEEVSKLQKEPKKTEPQNVEVTWPQNMERIPEVLTALHAEAVFYDPAFWQSMNAWTESTGLSVYPLDEFKAYSANQQSKHPGSRGKHKDLKSGFRNWVAIAIRMKERDSVREKQAAQYRTFRH